MSRFWLGWMVFFCLGVLVPSAGSASPSGQKEITLDLIYGESLVESLPRSLSLVPDGSTLVYVVAQGEGDDAKKTLYARDLRSGESRVLLSPEEYEELIGEAKHGVQRPSGRSGFSGFDFAEEGLRVLVVRDGDLEIVDLEEKTRRRLTASNAKEAHAAFSPDGDKVSFVRDHNVFLFDLKKNLEVQVTADGEADSTFGESNWVYDEELSLHGGLWWSPKGTHLVVLHFDQREVPSIPIVDFKPTHKKVQNQRYPKAGDANPKVELWVADVSDEPSLERVELPDLGDGYVARVTFVPDGSKFILQLLNRRQDELRLFACDVKSRELTPLFTEKSPWWINVHDDLQCLENGQMVWASERDGWNHLYLYDSKGELVRQLTRGEWVVAGIVGIDEAKETVYFTATEKSRLERHLYEVRLSGEGLRRVSQEEGDHTILMSEGARYYVDSWSTADRSPQMILRASSGEKIATLASPSEEKLEELARRKVEFVEVPTEDGLKLPGFWIKPPDFDPSKKYPVLFYVYGGPQSQTVRNRWGGSRYLWHQMLANRGLLVFSMDNRASFGMGLKSAGVIRRQLGKIELADLLQGVRYLKTLPYVDAKKLGIWGWSYGGTMASYSILNAPETFAAAVAVAPVTKWENYDTIYTERYMDTPEENPEGYEAASVVGKAAELTGALLLSHGTGDDNVHFQNAVQLASALIEEGKNFEFLMYPGGKHGIGGKKVRKQMFTAITAFLFRNLLGREMPLVNTAPESSSDSTAAESASSE